MRSMVVLQPAGSLHCSHPQTLRKAGAAQKELEPPGAGGAVWSSMARRWCELKPGSSELPWERGSFLRGDVS